MLASCIVYAINTNSTIYLLWDVEENRENKKKYMSMNEHTFLDFFDEKSFIYPFLGSFCDREPEIIYTEWLPFDNWYSLQSFGQMKYIKNGNKSKLVKIVDDLPEFQVETILIESSLKINRYIYNNKLYQINKFDLTEIYQKYFIPKQKYKDALASIPNFDIGISIRKNEDFLQIYPESRYMFAPGNLFLERFIGKLLNDGSFLIIFSDDHIFRNELINKLLLIYPNKIYVPNFSFEDWEQPLFEFLILAYKCDKIYGTKNSSFAEESSIFSGRYHYNIIE